jgi:hypothetical protein
MGLLATPIALSLLDHFRFCTLLAFLSVVLANQTLLQSHIHKGDVSGTWAKHNSPYFNEGDIRIPYGEQLAVELGVMAIVAGPAMASDDVTELFVGQKVHQLRKDDSANIHANVLWKWGVKNEKLHPKGTSESNSIPAEKSSNAYLSKILEQTNKSLTGPY